jgi:hypothetical protein
MKVHLLLVSTFVFLFSCDKSLYVNEELLYKDGKQYFFIDTVYIEARTKHNSELYPSPAPVNFDTVHVRMAEITFLNNEIQTSEIKKHIRRKNNPLNDTLKHLQIDEVIIRRPASYYFLKAAKGSRDSKTVALVGTAFAAIPFTMGILSLTNNKSGTAGLVIGSVVGVAAAIASIIISYSSDANSIKAANEMAKDNQ